MATIKSYNASQSDQVLHEQDGLDGGGFVVDSQRALQFAIDTAKGMAYLHSLDRHMPRFHLNSKHVMVSLGERSRAVKDVVFIINSNQLSNFFLRRSIPVYLSN